MFASHATKNALILIRAAKTAAEDNLSLARVERMESGIPFVTDRGEGGASLNSSGTRVNTRDTLTSSLHEERVIELQKDALQHEGQLALMKLSVSRLEAQLQESRSCEIRFLVRRPRHALLTKRQARSPYSCERERSLQRSRRSTR